MATAWSYSPIQHTDDATYRQWVREFMELMFTGGTLSQVVTGATNEVTITGSNTVNSIIRPAANTFTHWAVFQFTDSFQATAPYFVRVEFGSSATTTRPGVRLSVGTGVNGTTGVLSNVILSPIQINRIDGEPPLISQSYSFCCALPGFFGINFKAPFFNAFSPSTEGAGAFFSIGRMRNQAGAQTSDGIVIYHLTTSMNVLQVSHNRITNTTFAGSGTTFMVPLSYTYWDEIKTNPKKTVFRGYTRAPDMRPVEEHFAYSIDDFKMGNVFLADPLNTGNPKKYICLSSNSGLRTANTNSSSYSLAMIWE